MSADQTLARRKRAEKELGNYDFRATDDGWLVTKIDTGEVRMVSNSTCTCPDFENRGGPCKHMYMTRFLTDVLEGE